MPPVASITNATTVPSSSTPMTIPPDPTPLTTDASLLKAITNVVRYITRVASGFTPKGSPLDIVAYYSELEKATKPRHLSLVCSKMSVYCGVEAGLHKSPIRDTLINFDTGFASMADKFMQACVAHTESVHKRIPPSPAAKFEASFEYAHLECERAMMQIQSGRMEEVKKGIEQARVHWSECIKAILDVRSEKSSPKSSATSTTPTSAHISKLVDDILTIYYISLLFSRVDSGAASNTTSPSIDYFTTLPTSLLERELNHLCEARPRDDGLRRIKLSCLLQTSCGSAKERQQWRTQLSEVPIPSGNDPQGCLSSYAELLSIQEHSFIQVQLSLLSHTSIKSTLDVIKKRCQVVVHRSQVEALKSPAAAAPENQEKIKHTFGLEQSRILGISELSCAYLTQYDEDGGIRTTHEHIRRSLAYLNQTLPTMSTCSSLQRFSFLIIRTRLYLLWCVQAERRGASTEAKYLAQKGVEELEAMVYDMIASSPSAASTSTSTTSSFIPYTSLICSKLHLVRLYQKLDFCAPIQELLKMSGCIANTSDDIERITASQATYCAANGIHARQVREMVKVVPSTSTDSAGVDDLIEKMSALNTHDDSAARDNSDCTQCALFHRATASSSSLLITPCGLDSTIATLRNMSQQQHQKKDKKSAVTILTHLTTLLSHHLPYRYPPLLRILHHRLARLHASNGDDTISAWHAHESLAIAPRTELMLMDEPATMTPSTSLSSDISSFTTLRTRLPPNCTFITLDLDSSISSNDQPQLITSWFTRDTSSSSHYSFRTLSTPHLTTISSKLQSALTQADEASKRACGYNADRAMLKKAVVEEKSTTKSKSKSAATSKLQQDITLTKQAKLAIEQMRSDANDTIRWVCEELDRMLGEVVEEWLSSSAAADDASITLILSLGSSLSHLPWENMPRLEKKGVYRMNSLWFAPMIQTKESDAATEMVEEPVVKKRGAKSSKKASAVSSSSSTTITLNLLAPTVIPTHGYYVLNPQGNISASEEFAPLLDAQHFRGSVGSAAVNTKEWITALKEESKMFVYVGHNGGEEFVSPREILKLRKGIAAATSSSSTPSPFTLRSTLFQIGCSSSLQRLRDYSPLTSQYECEGLSLAYNQLSCPSVYGCLWNVPEDIDRWLKGCLEAMNEKGADNTTVMHHAKEARHACKQRYLTAASIVCYGMPVKLAK